MFKNTLKIIFTLILFLSSGSSVFAAEHQSIIVGTSGQTKPMDYFDKDKNLTGIEIDILKEIERRSDLHFKYEITEFPSLFAGLDSKKFDLVVNNLGEGDDRREKYLFSKYPYIVTHNKIITRQGERQKLSIADLSGKSVAAVASSPQSQFLESWNQKNPNKKINIVYVDSDVSQIIRDVHDGKFYATIYADTYVHDVEKTFGITLQQHNISNESKIKEPGSYFIYRKDQEKNRNKIDKILAGMRSDGTLRQISVKYLDNDETKLTPTLIEKNNTLEDRRLKKENSIKTNTEEILIDNSEYSQLSIVNIDSLVETGIFALEKNNINKTVHILVCIGLFLVGNTRPKLFAIDNNNGKNIKEFLSIMLDKYTLEEILNEIHVE